MSFVEQEMFDVEIERRLIDLNGYYFRIGVKEIESTDDAKAFLRDIRSLLQKHGGDDTFSW